MSFTCPYTAPLRTRTALRALNIFHQRKNEERRQYLRIKERRQYLRIKETAVGGRWPCLNTRDGNRRRNVEVLRSAPAASFSRQLMSESRSSRSAES